MRQLLETPLCRFEVGIDGESLAVMHDRPIKVALQSEGIGEVVVGLGEFSEGGNRHLELGDGLIEFALPGKFDAAQVLGFGVTSAGLFSPLVIPGGFARFSLFAKQLSDLLVGNGDIGVDFDRPAKMRDRFVAFVSLDKQQGELDLPET